MMDEFILFKPNNELVKHGSKIDKYVSEFKPTEYPLRKLGQIDSSTNPISIGSNDFYVRGSYPISFEIHKGINTINCRSCQFRVFEGMEFSKDIVHKINRISLVIGSHDYELKIKMNNKSYVMLDNFYIPLSELCYNYVHIQIIANDEFTMDCDMIGGSFYYISFGDHLDNDRIDIDATDVLVDDKYKKLVVRLGMGMFSS